jgi:hypothetical protein
MSPPIVCRCTANCLVVPHVVPEPAWAIGDALGRVGTGADVRRTFGGDPIPLDASGYAGVVVMGGLMSACSDDGFPSWRAEVALLAEALVCGAPRCAAGHAVPLGGHARRGTRWISSPFREHF